MAKLPLMAVALLGAALVASLSRAGELPGFRLVYQGEAYTALASEEQVKPARLYDRNQEQLVVRDTLGFRIVEFTDSNWVIRDRILLRPFDTDTMAVVWTLGNFNGDGRDEIVVFRGRRVTFFSWDGAELVSTSSRLPYLVEAAVAGDLDNDGRDELAMFCYPSWPGGDKFFPYTLVVARVRKNQVQILGTDSTRLGFENPVVIQPDGLNCIADVENAGFNQIVATRAQSDMSPTRYDLLSWRSDHLKRFDSFVISRDTFTRAQVEHSLRGGFPALIGDLTPVRFGDTTELIAMMYGPPQPEPRLVLLTIGKSSFSVSDTLWREQEDEWNYRPARAFPIDLDGKGKGILVLWSGKNGERFCFYRAKSEP